MAHATPIQVDLHLDTPTQLFRQGKALDGEGMEAGLAQLRAGGTNVAVEVLWPPRNVDHWKHTNTLLELVERDVGSVAGLSVARSPQQVRAIVDKSEIALLLSLEGAHGLGDSKDWQTRFDALFDRGLRLLGLTWSFSNRFAGSSTDQGGGLTDEGRALVAHARKRGVVLDVSHASEATTLEVCTDSPVPVIASHSNARSLKEHKRNLTDAEIKCIAATGGVIGLNFHAPFVGGAMDVGAVADHADHIAQVGGHAAVALGSDFDGLIRTPRGLDHAGQLGALWAELEQRGWTETQIAGTKGENFMRAWQKVLEARQ